MSSGLMLGLAGSAVLILVGAVLSVTGLGEEDEPSSTRLAVATAGVLMIFAGAGNVWLSVWEEMQREVVPAPAPPCVQLIDLPDAEPPRHGVCVPADQAG